MKVILALISFARSIPSLIEYYKKIKAKTNFPSVYEDTLYKSMQAAVKEVTDQDISDFELNEKIEIYEAALVFFEDPVKNANRLEKLFYSSNSKIKQIEDRFLFNLIQNGGLEIITYLQIQLLTKADRIEAGVNRIVEDLSLANIRLKEIQSSIKDIPKFINDFGEVIQPRLTQPEDKYKLDDTLAFFETPKIPDNFIKRTETLLRLKKKFDKKIIVVNGITRSGKSFLVSELIRDDNFDYLWYDFKLNETNGDNFFYMQLVKYCLADNPEGDSRIFTDGKNLNFKAITDTFKTKLSSQSKFFLVLDNIQLSKHIEQLDSFLKLLIDNAAANFFIILISEEKIIYKSFSSNIQNINDFQCTGFSVNEIKLFFEANGISTEKASDKFLELIHRNSNEGHPDIINGLTLELRNKNVNSLLSAEAVNQVLNSFKDLPAQQKIIKVVSDKIFTNILKSEDEKNLFIRLSCLIGIFTRELANAILSSEPPIPNYHLIFPPISEKLFDVHPDSKYSIPQIFQKSTDGYLSDKIKNEVYVSAAKYLTTPRRGVLNFNDGELACLYLFSAKHSKATFILATDLLKSVLIKFEEGDFVQNALGRFEIYTELGIREDCLNEQVEYLLISFEAYKRINDKEKAVIILDKIYSVINNSQLNLKLKHFASTSLLFFYIVEKHKNIEKIFDCSINFLDGLNEDYFPDEIKSKIDTNSFLKGLLLYSLNIEEANINNFNTFLLLCIKNNMSIKTFLDLDFIVEVFDVLWSVLYKKIKASNEAPRMLPELVTQLNESKEIFQKINFHLGLREIDYLIGLLYTDLADNPLDAVKYFNEANDSSDKLQIDDKEFLSKNWSTCGDAYFRAKEYEKALEKYLIAEDSFKLTKSMESLRIHSLIRMGICYHELKNYDIAEKYLWKAFCISRQSAKKNTDLMFVALAELSTFYIKNAKYLEAIKCFSIIIQILSNSKYSAKDQVMTQSFTWLYTVKNENTFDVEKFNRGDKVFVKPYWGMYANPTYVDLRPTKLNTLYVLAESYSSFNYNNRANNIYKIIIKRIESSEWDVYAKFLSTVKLMEHSLRNDNYETLIFCFQNMGLILKHYNEYTTLELPNKDTFAAIDFFCLKPIMTKYVRRYDTQDAFIVIEKFFMKLVELSSNSDFDFSDKLYATTTSAIGLLYGINFRSDKSYRNISFSWLSISNDKALQLQMIEVFVSNKNMQLFFIAVIHDLKSYLILVFEYFFQLREWIQEDTIVKTCLIKFYNFINSISYSKATEEELKIQKTLKDILKNVNTEQSNSKDDFVSLIIGFLKLRLIVDFDRDKVIAFYKFLLENMNTIHQKDIEEIITNYFSLHNDIVRKHITNDDYVKTLNDMLKSNLVSFLDVKKDLLNDGIRKIVSDKINQLP